VCAKNETKCLDVFRQILQFEFDMASVVEIIELEILEIAYQEIAGSSLSSDLEIVERLLFRLR